MLFNIYTTHFTNAIVFKLEKCVECVVGVQMGWDSGKVFMNN